MQFKDKKKQQKKKNIIFGKAVLGRLLEQTRYTDYNNCPVISVMQ